MGLRTFNEYKESSFKQPDEATINRFQKVLHKNDFISIIRHSRGEDISAACGQLRAKLKIS